jgi:hypothetical protein
MNHHRSPVLAAVVACLAVPAVALAQAAASDQQPTNAAAANAAPPQASEPASPPAAQVPAAASDQPPAAAPAQPPAAQAPSAPPADTGPVVGYIKHTKPPFMVDQTIASAELGMIGAAVSISAGHDIVKANNIEDPSVDVARQVAAAYAATQGGHVADAPISDDQVPPKTKMEDIGHFAAGARYVVNVAPVNMEIIYFVTDPLRRDLMLGSTGEIVDASSGKVVAKGRCFVKSEKVGERYTHDQLLDNEAAALKTLIARKSQECAEKMEASMKIAPPAASAAAPGPAAAPGS